MLHSLMMFLAPATAQVQATPTSPPAVARPVRAPARVGISLRFLASVAGSALGFALLLAGFWMVLLLIQALL